MLSRDDFVFTIGYDGPVAIVDGQARRRYRSLSTKELIDKGLFKAAYSSAVYSKNQDDINLVADAYTRLTGTQIEVSAMNRLFGVYPTDTKRILVL